MLQKIRENQPQSHYLTLQEAAEYLDVHVATIRRWANARILKGRKIGIRGDWRFKEEELQEIAKSNVTPGDTFSLPDGSPHTKNSHFVHFYEKDAFLLDSILRYIESADAAVIIATAEHRKSLQHDLNNRSTNGDLTKKNYLLLDATETLSKIMVNDKPNQRLFEKVIGTLIKDLVKEHKDIRAYGEMVAVLWAQGNKEGAVRLEELWNELQKELLFTVYCAYPVKDLDGKDSLTAFPNVLTSHARVIPSESFLTIPQDQQYKEVSLLQQKAKMLELEIEKNQQIEQSHQQTIAALTSLYETNLYLWQSRDSQDGLQKILQETITLLSADFGNVQLLNPQKKVLEIAVQKGFKKEFLTFFKEVSAEDDSACGRSLRTGKRIIIEDVTKDKGFAPYKEAALKAGFRAVQSTPLIGRDGSPLGMISTHFKKPHIPSKHELFLLDLYARQVTDFIERIDQDAKLQESEARLRRLFNANIIGIFVSQLDGTFLEANDALLSLIGYTREELQEGKVHRDKLTPPEYESKSRQAVKGLKEKGVSNIYEKEYLHKDGRRIPVLIAVARIGNSDTCIGYVLDISERKHAEVTANRLAAIIADSADAIVSKNLDGVIQTWNDSAERIFGYSAKEAIGKHITLIIPPKLRYEEDEIITKIKNGNRIDHYETVRMRKDGKRINVSLTISPIKDRSGTIVGASKIARDITEKIEQEKRKDDFLSMASHELKTPLTSMLMYLEVLNNFQKSGNAEKATIMTGKIKEQTNRLKELVNDLLDVSRIQTGKLLLHHELFLLDELIQETIDTVQTTTNRHSIKFNKKDSISLRADRFRVYQVLVNLLTNAIKYSPYGSDIIVRLQKNHKDAYISVQDFGVGIDKEHQEKVFDKLYQVPDPEEKTYPGLGIGLYISKEIIHRHNGKIWVESTKGKGSTFYASLPLVRAD